MIIKPEKTDRPDFDWARFAVRFLFGFLPGGLLGFGFWIQMCRSSQTLGLMEHVPRLVTKWLGLEETIDSGFSGLVVMSVFAFVSGLIVAAWPSISNCPNDAFMTFSILLDGIARHPPMDGLCGMECPSYPEKKRVRFSISLDTYCCLRTDEFEHAPSGTILSQGKHSLVIKYAGHKSEALFFTVKAGKKQNKDR